MREISTAFLVLWRTQNERVPLRRNTMHFQGILDITVDSFLVNLCFLGLRQVLLTDGLIKQSYFIEFPGIFDQPGSKNSALFLNYCIEDDSAFFGAYENNDKGLRRILERCLFEFHKVYPKVRRISKLLLIVRWSLCSHCPS